MSRFVSQNMWPEFNVDYADEGRIYVLSNGCLNLATEEEYKNCTLPPRYAPQPAGATVGVNVLEFSRESATAAIPWVKQYRWITINPSYTSVESAVAFASSQLKIMRWPGVVLVYLPHGPDKTKVDDYATWEERWDEANRYICGGYKVHYPIFQKTLTRLVDAVTRPDPKNWPPIPLVVTAFSFSGPYTLEAIQDNPQVLYYNVAPSFGWASWNGDESHTMPLGLNCKPDDKVMSVHELTFKNPHLSTYRDALAFARVPQCMLTSYGDCISTGFNGSALTAIPPYADLASTLTHPAPEMYCNDKNLPSELGYDPSEPAISFWCASPPDYAGQRAYEGPVPGDVTRPDNWGPLGTEFCYQYGNNSGLLQAIQANLQTRNTVRIIPVETPSASEDLTYQQTLTHEMGESQPMGHAGYWLNGRMPEHGVVPPVTVEEYTANYNFREYLQQCPGLFNPSDCPACDLGDDWSHGRPPASIKVTYASVHPSENELVWFGGPVDSHDVIYRPAFNLGELPLQTEYTRLLEKFNFSPTVDNPGNGSLHISANAAHVHLDFDVYPPDPDANAYLTNLSFKMVRQDPVRDEVVATVYSGAPNAQRHFTFAWDRGFANQAYYTDVIGVWQDLYASASFVDGDKTYATGDVYLGRVLDMKTWGGSSKTFPTTVPDIRNFKVQTDATGKVLATSTRTTLNWDGYYMAHEKLPSGEFNKIPLGTVDVRDTHTGLAIPTPMATLDQPRGSMNAATYRSDWNVKASWCKRFPTDQRTCGGATVCANKAQCPPSATFRIRIKAFNKAGNYFFREHDVTVTRP